MGYNGSYKRAVLAKVFGPPRKSASSVAYAEGIAASTVCKWVKEQQQLTKTKYQGASNPKEWKAEEKLATIVEIDGLPGDERGAYLRKKGLYEATIKRWREEALAGLSGKNTVTAKTGNNEERHQIKALENELQEKEKALAEMAVLLALKKKAQALLGVEENGTHKKKGR
jgi:hypothetical protein